MAINRTPTYHRLTRDDRIRIEVLYNQGYSNTKIAALLGVSRQTIWSEIKRGLYEHRNSDYTTSIRYSCDKAQVDAELKASMRSKELRVGNDWDFVHYVSKKIVEENYSPEGVIGELKRDGNPFRTTICVRTLYNYIYAGLIPGVSMRDLPYKRKRKKGKIKRERKKPLPSNAESIEKRGELSDRDKFGNWEMDSVVGPSGKSKKAMLVLTERKTRKELIRLLEDHTAASVVSALKDIRSSYPGMIKTVTVDNGPEFSDVDGIINSNPEEIIRLFFCHPYSSWERGSNENANRFIRRWIPKGVNFDSFEAEDIQKIEDWINNYPRPMFQYRTSEMMWREELGKVRVIA